MLAKRLKKFTFLFTKKTKKLINRKDRLQKTKYIFSERKKENRALSNSKDNKSISRSDMTAEVSTPLLKLISVTIMTQCDDSKTTDVEEFTVTVWRKESTSI